MNRKLSAQENPDVACGSNYTYILGKFVKAVKMNQNNIDCHKIAYIWNFWDRLHKHRSGLNLFLSSAVKQLTHISNNSLCDKSTFMKKNCYYKMWK